MKIQRLQLSDLTAAPYNPRIELRPGMEGYERLKRSLDEFQLVQPPVWNRRTGHLVGGHQRVAVLRDDGETEVDCVVVDLPEDRERALNVALNNDRVGGEWDTPKLVELLDELRADEAVDETLTGFTASELNDLLLTPPPTVPEIEPPEPAETPVDVTLEVPPPRWEEVKTWIDALLAAEPQVRVHVRGGDV